MTYYCKSTDKIYETEFDEYETEICPECHGYNFRLSEWHAEGEYVVNYICGHCRYGSQDFFSLNDAREWWRALNDKTQTEIAI